MTEQPVTYYCYSFLLFLADHLTCWQKCVQHHFKKLIWHIVNQIKGRTLRVDHVKDYRPPKDSEDIDDVTKILREEGCAPLPSAPASSSSEDDDDEQNDVPAKKPKKGEVTPFLIKVNYIIIQLFFIIINHSSVFCEDISPTFCIKVGVTSYKPAHPNLLS